MVDTRKDESPTTDWRTRYHEGLEKLRAREAEWTETERLLCRTVIRLTLATSGLDARIEPHLKALRDAVRNGVESPLVRQRLEEISQALVHREGAETASSGDTTRMLPVAVITALLDRLPVQPVDCDRALELREKLCEGADAKALAPVIDELARICERGAAGASERRTGLLGRLFGKASRASNGAPPSGHDPHYAETLVEALSLFEGPADLKARAEELRGLLEEQHLSAAWSAVLDGTIRLIGEFNQRLNTERREMRNFLDQVREEIATLTQAVGGLEEDGSERNRNDRELEQGFAEEISALANSVRTAQHLDALKREVAQGLKQLHGRMAAFHSSNGAIAARSDGRVAELKTRVSELEQESDALQDRLREMHGQVLRDALTGTFNRLAYDERIAQEQARFRRFGTPLALIVCDIDHFKNINDRYGHKAGDKVLKAVATTLTDHLRETDFIARYGGEEFVVILPGADRAEAIDLSEALRAQINTMAFHADDLPVTITASFGVTVFTAGDTPDTAFERADKALYKAKQEGRNRSRAA